MTNHRLPAKSSLRTDHVNMMITLIRRTRFSAGHSSCARRNDYLDIVTVVRDCFVCGRAIICTIGHHLADFFVDLSQQ